MQLVANEPETGNVIVSTERQKVAHQDNQGKPVYLFRSLIAEMSQLGSDLVLEGANDYNY